MKLAQFAAGSAAVLVVGCLSNPASRAQLRNAFPPLTRFLGGSDSDARNLRAEVESAFPTFIVPDDRVEYPKQRLAAFTSKLTPWSHHHPDAASQTPLLGPNTRNLRDQSSRHRAIFPRGLGWLARRKASVDQAEYKTATQRLAGQNKLSPPSVPWGKLNIPPTTGRETVPPTPASTALPPTTSTATTSPSGRLRLWPFPLNGRRWEGRRVRFHLPRPKRGIGIVKIHPLPPDVTPLVALVNSKSGGRQGKNLLKRLRTALSKAQVFDIQKTDIREALRLYSGLNNPITVLVCGGDGTASRVFEIVESIEWRGKPPKIAIVPLGTGNDLARVLDWNVSQDWSGGYFSGDADKALIQIFGDLKRALNRKLDRWELTMTEGTAIPSLAGHKQPVKYMLGYLGIGVDGKVALDFHRLREQAPYLFLNPTLNKFYYALMGFKDFFARSCKNLSDKVELWCDGQLVTLPPQTESFIVLNINSHAGGVELWPEYPLFRPRISAKASENFRPSRFDDALLEVVAISGVLHLGAIRVGLDRPVRLAQARDVRIRTKSFLPGQVDGEPWRLPRCELTLRHAGQAPVLQHVSKELLSYSDWLVEQGKIDATAKDRLVESFKRKDPI